MHLNTFQYKIISADECMKDNYQYYFSKNTYEVSKGDNKQTVICLWQIVKAEKVQFEVKSTVAHRLFITDVKCINVFQNDFDWTSASNGKVKLIAVNFWSCADSTCIVLETSEAHPGHEYGNLWSEDPGWHNLFSLCCVQIWTILILFQRSKNLQQVLHKLYLNSESLFLEGEGLQWWQQLVFDCNTDFAIYDS